ncbi:AhpA/YtjB family protein, partial [Pseudomonas sp. SIMBA_068]|uniref:AhpA/YtjB family protein n=1 Tax=Pseudomonas sp. SIMBA_068 TaxID=3085808 RepID=UPI00397B42E8
EELAHTLTSQVAFSLKPLMDNSENNRTQIEAILNQMTANSRILDASVYSLPRLDQYIGSQKPE